MDQQAPPLPPGLYLVATPIGNLGDITLRALDILKRVDRIACEDRRQTQKLLNHFEITTPTVSCHQHNERARAVELVEALKASPSFPFPAPTLPSAPSSHQACPPTSSCSSDSCRKRPEHAAAVSNLWLPKQQSPKPRAP